MPATLNVTMPASFLVRVVTMSTACREQEGNGPLDSRAKVMNSDKKCGPIYLKSETNSYCSCILHRSYLTEQESDGEFTN